MASSAVPDSVKRLIAERIDSVPELEALLLLREHADRGWTPGEAGQRLYVSTAVATHVLAKLAGHGFLSGSDGVYRYAAESGLAQAVDQLADAYSHHLVQVTEMIHNKPPPSIRHFANAFRLRKDKP